MYLIHSSGTVTIGHWLSASTFTAPIISWWSREMLMTLVGRIAKVLYWKLCFPQSVTLVPLRLQIVSGPFKGMRYVGSSYGSYHSYKLLGTYEKELHSAIASIKSIHYDTFVDIGAAEGYYAVGLASTLAARRLIAFEEEERGRSLLGELAKLNSLKERPKGRLNRRPERSSPRSHSGDEGIAHMHSRNDGPDEHAARAASSPSATAQRRHSTRLRWEVA